MRKLLILALLLVAAGIFSRGAGAQTTLNLSDCTASSLSSEWGMMSSGAYVLVFPSCSGTAWSGALSLTVPANVTSVTVEGQTSVGCTGTAGQSGYSCTATDGSVIEDAYQSNNPLVQINANGAFLRVTGMTIEGGNIGNSEYAKFNGILQIGGTTQARVDHDHFNNNTYSPGSNGALLYFGGCVNGVVDHNRFDGGNNTSVDNAVKVITSCGDSIGLDHGTFNAVTGFGSSNFVFLESNYFEGGAMGDCDEGGRVVWRYNNQDNESLAFDEHSTFDYGGSTYGSHPYRGCRAAEVYHNYMTGSNSTPSDYAVFQQRNATALFWDNTVASGWIGPFLNLFTDRNCGGTGAGCTASNGGGAINNPNGWGYCGTGSNGTGSNWDGNTSTSTGYPCLDGVGRGQTTQSLNGQNFPNRLNSSTGTIAWPRQYLEPDYDWGNSFTNYAGNPCTPAGCSGGSAFINLETPAAIQNNRDIYEEMTGQQTSASSPFNGTSGTGWGPLADRPTTCTGGAGGTFYTSPTGSYGVGYFATDANGGVGELYVCTATNTWTAIYQPYTYPHPLVSGGGGGALTPPSIAPASGNYSSPQTVTITGPSGATVCYRTDGNSPSASTPGTCDAGSTTYAGPFSLTISGSGGAIVQAIATESGQLNSSVASASYTLQTCNQTPLGANWICVGEASNYTGLSVTSVTAGPIAANVSAGSLVVVFQWELSNAICVAPTDTLETSFTALSSASVSAISMQLCDWYGVALTGGADSATCNAASTAAGMACMAVNVTGQSTGTIVDQTCTRSGGVSASGINNMSCANSITAGTPNELVLAAAFGDYGTRSAGNNFTMIDPNNWSGEYFMEAAPMIWTPTETIGASGLNYGFLAVTLEPYNAMQTLRPPTGLIATVQ